MGKTLANMFSSFQENDISQLYFHSEIPTVHGICGNYYRITDRDAIKSILNRKHSGIRIAKQFIACMPKYPFGGGLARKEIHNYAHNILLEIYDMYGVIPFLIISVFYIQGINNIFKVFKYGNDLDCNYLLVGLYIAIMIQMFLEPVIEGFPILLYVFLFMHGMCKAYIKFGLIGELVHEDSGDKYL